MAKNIIIWKSAFQPSIEPVKLYISGMPSDLILAAGQKVIVSVEAIHDDIHVVTVEREDANG